MESKPSSGPETPVPLLPEDAPAHAADGSWVRSRRVQTFALGALVGALALSLLVVVTSIFAAAQNDGPYPAEPAPASDVRPSPRATTPAPTPVPTPAVTLAPEEADGPVEAEDATEPSVEPAPAPTQSEPPATDEDEAEGGPGRSDSAPGQTKKPESP